MTRTRLDDEFTGHGSVNAGNAMEFLAAPWVLTHHTTTGGTPVKKTNDQQVIFNNDAGIPGTLATGSYIADQYVMTRP